jgi:bacterioferritin-associated ferredoxin
MYICVCKAITKVQLKKAIEQGKVDTLGIGSVCGMCLANDSFTLSCVKGIINSNRIKKDMLYD